MNIFLFRIESSSAHIKFYSLIHVATTNSAFTLQKSEAKF